MRRSNVEHCCCANGNWKIVEIPPEKAGEYLTRISKGNNTFNDVMYWDGQHWSQLIDGKITHWVNIPSFDGKCCCDDGMIANVRDKLFERSKCIGSQYERFYHINAIDRTELTTIQWLMKSQNESLDLAISLEHLIQDFLASGDDCK